jgi:hypothetical protein
MWRAHNPMQEQDEEGVPPMVVPPRGSGVVERTTPESRQPEPEPVYAAAAHTAPMQSRHEPEETVYYHAADAAEPSGEVPLSELCCRIADGTVPAAGSSLWQEGMAGWAPIVECVDAFDGLAVAVDGCLAREQRESVAEGGLSPVQSRWKRGRSMGQAIRGFMGNVYFGDFPGCYGDLASEQLDLAQYDGLINAALIGVPEHEMRSARNWAALRENRGQVVEKLRSPLAHRANRRAGGMSGMSIGEAMLTASQLCKHSALVFDCAEDHTTVYRLRYEPSSCLVRANTVAVCAGVDDIIRRNAGSWFLKFARLTCETQKRIGVPPEVVMIGTSAWYKSDSDGAEKKRLRSIWNKIDDDQSGSLDQQELRKALDDIGKVMSDEEFAKVWSEVDDDDSGHVCFDEFMAWYLEHRDAHHDAAAVGNADRARELVSSLTHSGMLCKRVGGSEQALFESLAVCEVACRLGMTPHPQYFVGTGGSWVHCVALNVSDKSPIVLCNDGVLGWSEGVRRLNSSLDPLAELDAWLQDTVVAELDAVESHAIEPIPELDGNIVLSGAAFEAAVVADIHSETDQLKPICAKDAIVKLSAVLDILRGKMTDNLLDFKTAPSDSPKYAEGQQVARQLCNLTLHLELLRRLVDAEAMLFFKATWSNQTGDDRPLWEKSEGPSSAFPSSSFSVLRTSSMRSDAATQRATMEGTAATGDTTCDTPTWVTGWYMHLLSNQFGVEFGEAIEVNGLIGHLNGLYSNAIRLADLYDEEHAGNATSASAMENERVALTLVTMQDVVEALRRKAYSRDPIATKALNTLSKKAGGWMEGLDYRFKSEESLFRKLIQRLDRQLKANEHIPHCALSISCQPAAPDAVESDAGSHACCACSNALMNLPATRVCADTPSMKLITFEVDDCLRFTIVIPTAIYTAGVMMILSRLTGSDPTDECAIASKVNAYNFWSTEKGVSTYMGINAFVTLHR